MPRVLLSNVELSPAQSDSIHLVSPDIVIETSQEISESGVDDVEILLLSDNRWLTPERVRRMKRLKFIQTLWAGVDSLNFAVVPDNVLVSGNVGGFSEPISEHVFGMIISLARNLLEHDRDLRSGVFDRSRVGIFLKGKKICILGTGGIGQAVAKRAKAFDMTTMGINTTGKPADYFDNSASVAELDSFISQSQVIVIALPLTVQTRNLLDARRLNLLTPQCIVVNVGRGKIIEEEALFDYLRSHPAVKFATDVWWRYPSKQGEKFAQHFPFFDLPNFMGSPHDADFVPESHEIATENAVQNILRFLRNETPKGIARKQDYIGLTEFDKS